MEAVSAARKLIAYYDIRLKEPQYEVLEAMQRGIPEDAFVVWDVTQFGYYARTHYQVNHPKTYIDSGYSFNLGYAFPTALGVKVARPDRPVICMAGDGGFMFNSSELSTALQYGINVVTVILQKRFLRQRSPRPRRRVWRDLRDRPAQPRLRQIRRVVRRRRHESKRPEGVGDADSPRVGAAEPGDYRRAVRRDAYIASAAVRAVLQATLDHASGGPYTVLMRWLEFRDDRYEG